MKRLGSTKLTTGGSTKLATGCRWLINGLAVLSLVLFIAMLTLWMRSYWWYETFTLERAYTWGFASADGSFDLNRTRYIPLRAVNPASKTPQYVRTGPPHPVSDSLQFEYFRQPATMGGKMQWLYRFGVYPTWFITDYWLDGAANAVPMGVDGLTLKFPAWFAAILMLPLPLWRALAITKKGPVLAATTPAPLPQRWLRSSRRPLSGMRDNFSETKGLRWWLFNALSAISLLICVAFTAIFVRSMFVSEDFSREGDGVNSEQSATLDFVWHDGRVEIECTLVQYPPGDYFGNGVVTYDYQRVPAAARGRWASRRWFSISHRLFNWRAPDRTIAEDDTKITIHCLLIILPTALLPAIRIGQFIHRRRRISRIGLCKECGYDLRATPDRCPECGAIPAVPNSK